MHALQQQYWAVREYLSPVLRESKFKEHGRITPEEFVAAGDFLTYKFPVWTWEKGDTSKAREYLPTDRQYLVTRGVPCLRRATSLAYTDAEEDAERMLSFDDSTAPADEWVETHAGRKVNLDIIGNVGNIDDIPDLDGDGPQDVETLTHGMAKVSVSSSKGAAVIETPDIDEIPDMEEEGLEELDDAAVAPKAGATGSESKNTDQAAGASGNLLQVRTYDVMITYDKRYQTPHIWLLGYDENRATLTPTQILQDVSADHALKTVTIEPFPHSTTLQAASVHPCKHAEVMKSFIERMNHSVVAEQLAQRKAPASSSAKDGKKKWLFGRKVSGSGKDAPSGEEEEVEGLRVDFYLVVFLKFVASIVPTIEVDSTTAF